MDSPLIALINTKKIIRDNPWNPWTNHKDFDIDFIKEHSRLIVDMRNMVEEGSNNVYIL